MNRTCRPLVLRLSAMLGALLVSGCGQKEVERPAAIEHAPTNNQQIQVEKLFDHDGCTAYRFWDYGYKYYVRCKDGPAKTQWQVPRMCGKVACPYTMEVPGA